jgi:1-acyl-sn-glycerol-3-phosphate acyltransferase
MLYKVLAVIVRWWLSIHYKRIFVGGIENFPETGPVMLAANHGNAFLDAITVCLSVKRPVWFLARADIFKKSWQRKLLHAIHIIPVYRMRDGLENMEKNNDTFNFCVNLLENNEVILMFPEGNAVPEKRLRPLKKGIARIAFQAVEELKWEKEIPIISVGINYVNHTQFRTEVMLGFSEPVLIRSFKNTYKLEQAQAIRKCMVAIENNLKSQMVIIPHKEQDYHAEIALYVARSERIYKIRKTWYFETDRLAAEQITISNFVERDTLTLRNKLHDFAEKSTRISVPLWSASSEIPKGRLLYLILGFFPAVIGIILNVIPAFFAKRITTQIVKDPQFTSSILLGTGLFLTLIWSIILAIMLGVIIHPVLFVLLIIIPLSAKFSLIWLDALAMQRVRFIKLSLNQKNKSNL